MVGGLSRPALRVLHVDDHVLVIDKPAGVLCVPGRGPDKQACLAVDAQVLYPDALVVHRLDMATSGVWLMARGAAAQTHLGKAFAARRVAKRYVAVVAGVAEAATDGPDRWHEIDLPLARDWPNRPRSIVDLQAGKPSVTRWRVLGPGPQAGTTRLELEPVTGRTHQLRVHLSSIGHPILGDALYAPPAVLEASERLLLHASELHAPHPADDALVAWHSAAPF